MRIFITRILLALCLVTTAAANSIPGSLNLTSYQGERFSKTFVMKDGNGAVMNLTGYSYKAMVRKSYTDTVPLAEFGVTISPVAGEVTLSLTSVQTTALANTSNMWDLQQTAPDGTVSYLLRGTFRGLYSATR